MNMVKQGTVLQLDNPAMEILVLSKDFFNKTGMAVACPVVREVREDALHIPLTYSGREGVALLEQLRSLDLRSRHFKVRGEIDYSTVQEIAFAVQSIFDYYPYSLVPA